MEGLAIVRGDASFVFTMTARRVLLASAVRALNQWGGFAAQRGETLGRLKAAVRRWAQPAMAQPAIAQPAIAEWRRTEKQPEAVKTWRAMRRVAVAGRYWNHPSDAEGKGELR